MANKRIKDLGTTASTLATDDYVAIDGNANGTRKIVKGDLVNDISTQVAGTYLDEANNLSDVASKDTSKLNLEVPDVGSSPNEVSLNGQLGSMAFQDSAGVSVGQLEADGGITATSDGNNTQLKLERTSSATGEFEIYTNTNKLYFKNVGDGNTYPLTLDGSKAGIGTVSPDRALHCYSGSVATVLKLDSAGADTGLEFAHSDTVAAGINCSTGGDLEFRTGANSGANQRVVIDSAGRVGIGTTSPSESLSVSSSNTGRTGVSVANTTTGGRTYIIGSVGSATDGGAAAGSFTIRDGNASANRLTIDSSGNATLNSGNLVIGTSGKGIDFGAVASGAGTVTPTTGGLLDDFETGTWSPTIAPNTGSFATATTYVYFAKYTKVGNLVTANCYIRTDGTLDITGGSSAVRIQGLPFSSPAANDYVSVNVGYAFNWSAAPAGGYIAANTNRILLAKRTTSITGNLNATDVSDLDTSGGAKNEIMISVTYQTT